MRQFRKHYKANSLHSHTYQYTFTSCICALNIIYLSLYHRANIHLHTIATDNGEERKAQKREKMERRRNKKGFEVFNHELAGIRMYTEERKKMKLKR